MENNDFLNIPRLLRYLGVLAVSSSATLALIQGVTSPISELTILGFLSFIVALLSIGIFSGTLLHEGKGGRVAVGLSLALVPPFFALLGAILLGDPNYATYWKVVPAISFETGLILTFVSSLVVIPTTLLGFRVLHREHHKLLSALHLIGAATLLVPIRDVNVMGALVALSCAGALFARYIKAVDVSEYKIAKLILWIAPIVLAIRTIGAYSYEALAFGMVLMVCALAISSFVRVLTDDILLIKPVEILSGLIGVLGALCLTQEIAPYASNSLITFGSIMGLITITLAQTFSYARREVENIGLGIILSVAMLSPYSSEMILSCSVSLILGVSFILLSIVRRSKALLIGGVCTFVISVLAMLTTIASEINFSSWLSLGVIGMVVIIISSLLEKRLPIIKARFLEGYKEISTW